MHWVLVFLDCHAFKLRDANAKYAIFTVIHSELFVITRRIQYLGLKPKLKTKNKMRKFSESFIVYYIELQRSPKTKASHKCTTMGSHAKIVVFIPLFPICQGTVSKFRELFEEAKNFRAGKRGFRVDLIQFPSS